MLSTRIVFLAIVAFGASSAAMPERPYAPSLFRRDALIEEVSAVARDNPAAAPYAPELYLRSALDNDDDDDATVVMKKRDTAPTPTTPSSLALGAKCAGKTDACSSGLFCSTVRQRCTAKAIVGASCVITDGCQTGAHCLNHRCASLDSDAPAASAQDRLTALEYKIDALVNQALTSQGWYATEDGTGMQKRSFGSNGGAPSFPILTKQTLDEWKATLTQKLTAIAPSPSWGATLFPRDAVASAVEERSFDFGGDKQLASILQQLQSSITNKLSSAWPPSPSTNVRLIPRALGGNSAPAPSLEVRLEPRNPSPSRDVRLYSRDEE